MLDVVVTAQQPLALGRGTSAGASAPTHRHIPGSVLRGALAAAWIAEHGEPTRESGLRDEFVALFERNVRFGPLFAPGSTVVPLSVLRCKYQRDNSCAQIWHDEAFSDEEITEEVKEKTRVCESCGGPLARGRSEVEFLPGDAIVRSTRVALTAEGTAQDGALYTRDELAHRDTTGAPRQFVGRIVGDAPWLAQARTLFLGGRRSTSGAVTYQADPAAPKPVPPLTGRTLVLRLLSPAVFVDKAGRPSSQPDEHVLTELLGVTATVAHSWIRWDRVGGWHAAADLPKPEEHVIAAGSTYKLKLEGDPDPAALQRLRDHGVGLRRAEGFGWIELGQAERPRIAEVLPADSTDRVAMGMSDMLLKLDNNLGRWFLRELRRYHAYRVQGGPVIKDLLSRPKLEILTPQQRKYVDLLLEFDVQRIGRVVDALEARLRGVL
ncbi:type III-B CRISPR module-associated Cmr3 family protein [Goodfellowiella coeruleoviolacea]|uniref:CRISPR-associated protein Csx10 n=1 Tax=Goodfellowiella coeruleoviolacea TaxID=334858 RepID=A0AAE3GMX7_9PSEU|nr:type III-B CRISPR module-associated Cmr3 family protein [Goodfellowiella coeruleoviolacea]MCP2170354.1 CRISPR-associated protein Csx10 [Goodfellowiella coeruleoviolacea]